MLLWSLRVFAVMWSSVELHGNVVEFTTLPPVIGMESEF